MIDVSAANFEAEVIEASHTLPVLVDFWAPWCGPCKSLGPVLEKLETAFEGRFKLVKINSDDEQQIAGMFGIRSIPTCVLMVAGQPVDGFTGAQSEGQVQQFLDKHVPPALEETAGDVAAEEPPAEPATLSPEAQLEASAAALALDPTNDNKRCAHVTLALQLGDHAGARTAFAPLAPKAGLDRRVDALSRWLNAIENVASKGRECWTIAQFDAEIALNKRNFDARFSRAQVCMAEQQWTAALDELLEILMRDRAWSDELARKTYVAILELMEPPKIKVADGQIPPQDPVLASYRRRLSMIVLS